MSCDYQSILAAARCFECIPPGAQSGIQTKLLQEISGASGSVDQLMAAARCIATCIPGGILEEVKTNLLCEVVDNLEGGLPNPSVNTCTDADSAAFVTAAGLTDQTQIYAVCRLVTDLKTYPAVGTKYWNRDVLIYPIVGGTAASHAINLKTPGTFNLLFSALGVTHSLFGITGNAVNGYADTQYIVPVGSLNSFRTMVYLDNLGSGNFKTIWGVTKQAVLSTENLFRNVGGVSSNYSMNDNTLTINSELSLGTNFVQRKDNATLQIAIGAGNFVSNARGSTSVPGFSIYLLARNNIGVADGFGNCRISGFSAGDVFVNDTERAEYKSIWDAFETRVGRGHP